MVSSILIQYNLGELKVLQYFYNVRHNSAILDAFAELHGTKMPNSPDTH